MKIRDRVDETLAKLVRFAGSNPGKSLAIFFPCLVFLILLIIFSQGYIIFGAEGNYIVNFQIIREVGSSSWVPHLQGIGFPSSTLNGLVGVFDFFSFLQRIGLSIKTVNIISVWLVYVLPFLSMMWLLHGVIKTRFLAAYFISLFYVLNPFSTYHLQSVMFWNAAPLFVLPLVFACMYRYYSEKLKLFLWFGILTSTFSFSFSNIPYLGVFHIFLFISIIIIPFIQDIRWKLKTALTNLVILESSFVLFNAWWFINLIRFQRQDLALYYTKEFAIGWVKEYSTKVEGLIEKLFSLKSLISQENGNFFSDFYNSVPMIIILFIPIFLIVFNFFSEMLQWNSRNKKFIIATFFSILAVLFLNKGATNPFGDMYAWMLVHVPFFYMFKTPLEKFSVLLVFLIALALIPVFRSSKHRWFYGIFFIYLAACSIPYLTLNFMPVDNFEPGDYAQSDKFITKKYLYKKSYIDAAESLNKDKLDYRVLSLPGSVNYQTTILNHGGNKYYRGMDPFIFSVNKPFITAYFDPVDGFFDPIFDNLSNDSMDDIMDIYTVNKIVFNHDIYPSFGTFRENKEAEEPIIDVLSDKYEKNDFDSIDIFKRKDFLSHLYLPQAIILSKARMDKLPEIVSSPDYHSRSVIYFLGQNESSSQDHLRALNSELTNGQVPGSAVLEYKKINPTKYRLILHGAKGKFPIVFSEKFHKGWKMYLADTRLEAEDFQGNLSNYKILDGNGDSQANKDELKDYINHGWISTLGTGKEKTITHWRGEDNAKHLNYTEKYTVDFISKNNHGTIQNDNLLSGTFNENWFKKSIGAENSHLTANGYANSWLLDVDSLCNIHNSLCRHNADDTYDMEVIMEFWPERLYYLGILISAITLIISLLGLGLQRMKKR